MFTPNLCDNARGAELAKEHTARCLRAVTYPDRGDPPRRAVTQTPREEPFRQPPNPQAIAAPSAPEPSFSGSQCHTTFDFFERDHSYGVG